VVGSSGGGRERLYNGLDLLLGEVVVEGQGDGAPGHRFGDGQGAGEVAEALTDVGLGVDEHKVTLLIFLSGKKGRFVGESGTILSFHPLNQRPQLLSIKQLCSFDRL